MADFIVQKLLSTRSELYCSQGQISRGCATHAAASALTLLNIIGDPCRITAQRCEPQERQFWQKMKDVYADGISLTELTQRLDELDFSGLKLTHIAGSHYRVLAFTEMAVLRGNPVIASFAPISRPRSLHAVLVTGLEGKMKARRFVPHGLLINDSSGDHPGVGSHNAKMGYSPGGKHERSSLYVTAWERYRITLTDAVSLQLAGSARQDLKPP
jgi:hypothetical protein